MHTGPQLPCSANCLLRGSSLPHQVSSLTDYHPGSHITRLLPQADPSGGSDSLGDECSCVTIQKNPTSVHVHPSRAAVRKQATSLHALGKLRSLHGRSRSLDTKKLFAMSVLLLCLTRTMGFATIGALNMQSVGFESASSRHSWRKDDPDERFYEKAMMVCERASERATVALHAAFRLDVFLCVRFYVSVYTAQNPRPAGCWKARRPAATMTHAPQGGVGNRSNCRCRHAAFAQVVSVAVAWVYTYLSLSWVLSVVVLCLIRWSCATSAAPVDMRPAVSHCPCARAVVCGALPRRRRTVECVSPRLKVMFFPPEFRTNTRFVDTAGSPYLLLEHSSWRLFVALLFSWQMAVGSPGVYVDGFVGYATTRACRLRGRCCSTCRIS